MKQLIPLTTVPDSILEILGKIKHSPPDLLVWSGKLSVAGSNTEMMITVGAFAHKGSKPPKAIGKILLCDGSTLKSLFDARSLSFQMHKIKLSEIRPITDSDEKLEEVRIHNIAEVLENNKQAFVDPYRNYIIFGYKGHLCMVHDEDTCNAAEMSTDLAEAANL